MSFLQRLKGRGVRTEKRLQSSEEETALDKVAQLNVDVFQGENMIVVYAQASGTDMSDIKVSIEGDADIVLIEGRRMRPEHVAFPKKKTRGAFFTEECVWGDFYRRIILPESINIEIAEAKIKNGVLVLVLPLLRPEDKNKVQLAVTNDKKESRGRAVKPSRHRKKEAAVKRPSSKKPVTKKDTPRTRKIKAKLS